MGISPSELVNLDALRKELQEIDARKLEQLAAALLGDLLGLVVAVSEAGFQHGGDAGPVGRLGRRFRIEAKRYADDTSLSKRELKGEIDQALERDEALEAWLLVATREVSEQLEQELLLKGDSVGVPVLIVDWKKSGFPTLAALCTSSPEIVKRLATSEAAAAALSLKNAGSAALKMLSNELAVWRLGFETVREVTHAGVLTIWKSAQSSEAALGQNVAGGTKPHRIRRDAVHAQLDGWVSEHANDDSPAVAVGAEGVGKTWAVFDWIVDRLDGLPCVLIVPASSITELSATTVSAIKRFIAARVYELTAVRDIKHWTLRLDRLLSRPIEEGPLFTIMLDGLNQEPLTDWLQLFKLLQDKPFSGRIRIIATCREHYFGDRLTSMRSLVLAPTVLKVEVYGQDPGGELDQMLDFEGLKRADLHEDIIAIARTPRLFDLVIRLRERLVDAGQVTLHRLLWEYGRGTWGSRQKSFSESDWRSWLQEIAQGYLAGMKRYRQRELIDTAARADLDEARIYARFSDIVDGKFALQEDPGSYLLSPEIVQHSLGAALLYRLERVNAQDRLRLDDILAEGLDPISGLDQKAEILRAAVSIALEKGDVSHELLGALLTEWIQSQHVPQSHRDEVSKLARALVRPLLDSIERSTSHGHSSARKLAIDALRSIDREDEDARSLIVRRTTSWLSTISRELHFRRHQEDVPDYRAQKLLERIGIDAPCKRLVLGIPIEVVDGDVSVLHGAAPTLVENYPLLAAVTLLEAASITMAVHGRHEAWEGLKWLVMLNEIDHEETVEHLRQASENVASRVPEIHVHPGLSGRAAALLLWLTGELGDQDAAQNIDSNIDTHFQYERDYLSQPARSFFALERRHVDQVLVDYDLPVDQRQRRAGEFWRDPSLKIPTKFVVELRQWLQDLDVNTLDTSRYASQMDHLFESIEPVLARCDPSLLADLIRRKMAGYSDRPADTRYWTAVHVSSHALIVDSSAKQACRTVRLREGAGSEKDESLISTQLLLVELIDEPAIVQWRTIVEANLEFILEDFETILNPLAVEELDQLIAQYSPGTKKQVQDLLLLLAFHYGDLSEAAWSWVQGLALDSEFKERAMAFEVLVRFDASRFGRELVSLDWCWSSSQEPWINHYGSEAVSAATLSVPFDQIVNTFAPWTLPAIVTKRGQDPMELRLAAMIMSATILDTRLAAPEPGTLIFIDRRRGKDNPFLITLGAGTDDDESLEGIESLKALWDPDVQEAARKHVVETAVDRIRDARRAGASLYLTSIDAADLEGLVRECGDLVDKWLHGMEAPDLEFRRRVRLAEGLYVSICEVLLNQDPPKGVSLWRALRSTLSTRFSGADGVDDLLLMLFKARPSNENLALMDEVLGVRCTNTDKELFDLAMAADLSGKNEWILKVIEKDKKSGASWRMRRADVLAGFQSRNALPIERRGSAGVWEGQVSASDWRRFTEACAYYWWKQYWAADSVETAYAAWLLLLNSADRRVWIWYDEIASQSDRSLLTRRKKVHAALNRRALKRAADKRSEKLDRQFLERGIVHGIGPWSVG